MKLKSQNKRRKSLENINSETVEQKIKKKKINILEDSEEMSRNDDRTESSGP